MKKNAKKISKVILFINIIIMLTFDITESFPLRLIQKKRIASNIKVLTNDIVTINDDKILGLNDIRIESIILPQRVIDYINERAPVYLELLVKEADIFGISIKDPFNLRVGEPITVYQKSELGNKESLMCYVPIYEGSSIVQTWRVLGNLWDEEGYVFLETSNDLVDELNYLFRKKYSIDEGYFIADKGELFLLEDDKSMNLTSSVNNNSEQILENEIYNKNNEIIKIKDTFGDKIKSVECGTILNSNIVVTDEMLKEDIVVGNKIMFKNKRSISIPISKVLIGSGDSAYCVTQKKDGACWAASVATCLRYKFKNYKITDENVSNKVGLKVGEGGISNIIPSFEQYGINGYRGYYLNISQYKNENNFTDISIQEMKNKIWKSITYGNPVLLKVVTPKFRLPYVPISMHVINIVGYNKSTKIFRVWDPKANATGKGVYKIIDEPASASDYDIQYVSDEYGQGFIWDIAFTN